MTKKAKLETWEIIIWIIVIILAALGTYVLFSGVK
jgi:hypothetical protein